MQEPGTRYFSDRTALHKHTPTKLPSLFYGKKSYYCAGLAVHDTRQDNWGRIVSLPVLVEETCARGASTARLSIILSPRSPHLLWTLVWPCKSFSKGRHRKPPVLREWSTRERICALWRKRWRKRFDYPTEKGTPAKRIRIEKKTIYSWRSLEAA